MEIILKAENVGKTYHAASGDVRAVDGVSFAFQKGMFYAIIGRSGSGKSTLLHMLGGLDRPTDGKVRIAGVDLYSYSDEKTAIFRRRHMGFIFQQFNLLDEYTSGDNIRMPLRLDGRKADERFFGEITEHLRISDKLGKYPPELSGGEQQRVAIARAVISKPKLIYADEPTGNLDKKTGEDTMRLLLDCTKRMGQTLIMATHDLDIAKKADVVLQLEDGKLL